MTDTMEYCALKPAACHTMEVIIFIDWRFYYRISDVYYGKKKHAILESQNMLKVLAFYFLDI